MAGEALTTDDLRNSFLFGRIHDMRPSMVENTNPEDLKNMVFALFPTAVKKWNDANPTFEGSSLLSEAIDAHQRNNYNRFGELLVQIEPLLQKAFESEPYEETSLLIASIDALHDDDESANQILYWILLQNANGIQLSEDFQSFWIVTAMSTDLEKWTRDKYGIGFEGPSKFDGKDSNGNSTSSGQSSGTEGGGCYVATAVYGSYDCPEVWTLRRYRDYGLAQTWYGRAFIHTYYAISPTLVKLFGKTQWFKKLFKGRLDRMVKRLQSEGYKSTPYNDRHW